MFMGFFSSVWQAHKQKAIQRNISCDNLVAEVNCAIQNFTAFFDNKSEYVDVTAGERFLSSQSALLGRISEVKVKPLKRAKSFKILQQTRQSLFIYQSRFINDIHSHNRQIAEQRLNDAYRILGMVEGKKLDSQQMLSIIEESRNHLVIAGAGTGKTTTIIGKIKWLLYIECCKPEDILVLSFTNASASEMRDRIQKEIGKTIEASTFHKLGLNIIKASEGVYPKITDISLQKLVRDELDKLLLNPQYLQDLSSYLLYSRVPAKSEFDFKSEDEYQDYLRTNPPTTLVGETVKSYGEMDIANFFSQNGIRYIYECPYKLDTRTDEYSQYSPDFYLPDYDVYIEYFGVNENGDVPTYFTGRDGKTASESYRDSMEWKRTLHNESETILIECFAYEKFAGTLLKNLEANLKKHSVPFSPKTPKQLMEELQAGEESVLNGFIELTETTINLIKSNKFDIVTVRSLIPPNNCDTTNSHLLLNLIEPIYNSYCSSLQIRGEIDFNDMINNATDYVHQVKYNHNYKYVIVDEYQDISKARFSLLKAMRDHQDYSLFCVGDDWQSIYRFAGSDIGFILNFRQFWGETAISKIETTYRFPQGLIDISGQFVMQNPNQVKKSIRGNAQEKSFPLGEIVGYTENNLADFLAERLKDLPKDATVFFIGRYSFDIDYIKNTSHFVCTWDKSSGSTSVVFNRRSDLKIQFLTAHKSKGLQADFIFILNNKKSRMGFPTKMQDAPILNLLLESGDTYPYAEERRLFYVAITRAKKKVILMTLKGKESDFEIELKLRYGEEMRKEAFACPLCNAPLVKKSGPYSDFLGCANYRSTGCTYKRQLRKKATENNS